MTTADDRPRCTAPTASGEPCKARALPGKPYCFAHAPELAERREEARRRGGEHTSTANRLYRLAPPALVSVFELLGRALTETHDGTLRPEVARAMAAVAGAMVRVIQAGELEQRVRDLERGHDEEE